MKPAYSLQSVASDHKTICLCSTWPQALPDGSGAPALRVWEAPSPLGRALPSHQASRRTGVSSRHKIPLPCRGVVSVPSTFSQQTAKKEFARMGARRAAKHRVLRKAHEQRCQSTAACWSQSPVHLLRQAGSTPLPSHTRMSNCVLMETLENSM